MIKKKRTLERCPKCHLAYVEGGNALCMAAVKRQKELKLSKTMLAQIASYADDREQSGWYYGNKAQFEKRHEAIKAWLQQELTKESSMLAVHGIVIVRDKSK